ncbi:MAG TPA: CBS domain-containing protein [Nitrospirae bacterium]|nr:CBS domain-containing protein [Nitrospirota bacterium]
MPIFGELFLSEILKKPILDLKGDNLGTLRDIIIVKGEPLPVMKSLIVLRKKKKKFLVPWETMSIFNKRVMASTLNSDELARYEPSDEDLLAVRDILDKQIVDATGAKVVRVNDIKLEGFEGKAILVAVDVGMRGILRRLGIERQGNEFFKLFRIELPHNLISWTYIQPLEPKLKTIALTVPRQMLANLHPADIAEIISSVSREEGTSLFTDLDLKTAAETLSELEPDVQASIITEMEPEKASDIIEEMPPDEAADILGDLPTEKMKALLESIDQEDAEDIQELLEHEENTAGGLMTNEFIAYEPEIKVSEAIERFKRDAAEIETIYYIYIIYPDEKLIGVLSLRELILADPGKNLLDLMVTNLKTLKPEDNENVVAAAISKYNLAAIPVVDNDNELLGIVTMDDIIDRILPPKAKRKRKKV